MFDPFDGEEDSQARPRPPFPTPTGALLLTFGASLASLAVALLFFEEIDVLALGVGEALGVGGVATLAARRVPDPQPERLGLRGFSPRLLLALLCLVPVVFLTSELDNLGRSVDEWLPPLGFEDALVDELPIAAEEDAEQATSDEQPAGVPDESATGEVASGDAVDVAPAGDVHEGTASREPEEANEATGSLDAIPIGEGVAKGGPVPILPDPPEGWELVQIAIVTVGIAPVVEGFLFFGVILQGLVAWLGRGRGLLMTGCLYALIHAFGQAGPDAGVFQALAAIASFIGIGVALGIARLATGSVIAPILLDTAFKAVALVAMTSPALLAVPGYNVEPDAHTPLAVLLPSALAVAWGLHGLRRRERGA